jgi:hypothetical protein
VLDRSIASFAHQVAYEIHSIVQLHWIRQIRVFAPVASRRQSQQMYIGQTSVVASCVLDASFSVALGCLDLRKDEPRLNGQYPSTILFWDLLNELWMIFRIY